MHRNCPECERKSVNLGRYPWSVKNVNCDNCGATFELKNTYLSAFNEFVWHFLVCGGFILALFFLNWKFIIVTAFLSFAYFPYHKAKYGELKLSGLRSRLKESGVVIDPKKAECARKKANAQKP